MAKKKKRVKVLKGEKIVYTLIIIVAFLFPISTVFTKAVLSETNISVEKMKDRVLKQEEVNESLSMQVDELASLDKIQEVASSKGLSYNNTNIKNILGTRGDLSE